MRKDSVLLNYYYDQLPKYQEFGLVNPRDLARQNMSASESTSTTLNTTNGRKSTATTGVTKAQMTENAQAMLRAKRAEELAKQKRIAERKAASDFSKGKTNTFTLPTGETKTLDQMDWREKQYVAGKSLENKGKINENDEAWYDDYLNPANWITSMAGALGEAPYEAEQSGSNLPYVSAVLNPLVMGRMMGSGSINPLGKKFWTNEVTNGEFANGMANGLPGIIKDIVTGTGEYSLPTWNRVKTFAKRTFPQFDKSNLEVQQSGQDWMEQWYNHPLIRQRIEDRSPKVNGNYLKNTKEWAIANLPKNARDFKINNPADVQFTKKSYWDLLKDKGPIDFIKYFPTTGGINYGNTADVTSPYINDLLYLPYNKLGKQSVITHEMTHGLTSNGESFTKAEMDELLKPFGMTYDQYVATTGGKQLPGLTSKSRKGYYLDPTEIHARINQARYEAGLKPGEEFTGQMYNQAYKKNKFNGMGRYVKDHTQLRNLINNFYGLTPAFLAGAAALNSQEEKQSGGMITDPMGQWKYPGQNTRIPSNQITMRGVNYPVLAKANNGMTTVMHPGKNYHFPGADYVDEYPMLEEGGPLMQYYSNQMKDGGEMIRRADGSYSRRGLWDNIRANRGSGKKPTKQMLEQERKIKSKNK